VSTAPLPARARQVVERIAAGRRPLLVALDVDGTLAPIVTDPEAARVPPPTRRLLAALARIPGVHIALVTGRDAGSLSRVARVPGAFRAVEHGRVVLGPGERPRRGGLPVVDRARLVAFRAWAEAQPGADVETKPASVAVHVRRLARRDEGRARSVLASARREARRRRLTPRDGRWVVEAEVSPGDKAEALARLVTRVRARTVLYAGDDLTDVGAIRAAAARGAGVFVRSAERRRTPAGASASVDGPDGVVRLLEALLDRLR